MLLVDLEHLLCGLFGDVAEKRHLERDLVDVSQVVLHFLNTARKHFVAVDVDALG